MQDNSGHLGAHGNSNGVEPAERHDQIRADMRLAMGRVDIKIPENNATAEQNALTVLHTLGLTPDGKEIPRLKKVLLSVVPEAKERLVTPSLPEEAMQAIIKSIPPQLAIELNASYFRDPEDNRKLCLSVDTLKMAEAMKKYFGGEKKTLSHMDRIDENRSKPAADGALR